MDGGWFVLDEAFKGVGQSRHRHLDTEGGGKTRLPKFKFSAKFAIGLHVRDFRTTDKKKIKISLNQIRKIVLTENPLGVQPCTPLWINLTGLYFNLYGNTYADNGRAFEVLPPGVAELN